MKFQHHSLVSAEEIAGKVVQSRKANNNNNSEGIDGENLLNRTRRSRRQDRGKIELMFSANNASQLSKDLSEERQRSPLPSGPLAAAADSDEALSIAMPTSNFASTTTQEQNLLELLKRFLSCAVCMETCKQAYQCLNGHLICPMCVTLLRQTRDNNEQSSGAATEEAREGGVGSGRSVNGGQEPASITTAACPVCRVPLAESLQRSLLAEQLANELPATCSYCTCNMAARLLDDHETKRCRRRPSWCVYRLFGCDWLGEARMLAEHVNGCPIANRRVHEVLQVVETRSSTTQLCYKQQLTNWNNILRKLRETSGGILFVINHVAMNRVLHASSINNDSTSNILVEFKSAPIKTFSTCCSLHAIYLTLKVIRSLTTATIFTNSSTTPLITDDSVTISGSGGANDGGGGREVLQLQYSLHTTSRIKQDLTFFINSMTIDNREIAVFDALRSVQFSSTNQNVGPFEVMTEQYAGNINSSSSNINNSRSGGSNSANITNSRTYDPLLYNIDQLSKVDGFYLELFTAANANSGGSHGNGASSDMIMERLPITIATLNTARSANNGGVDEARDTEDNNESSFSRSLLMAILAAPGSININSGSSSSSNSSNGVNGENGTEANNSNAPSHTSLHRQRNHSRNLGENQHRCHYHCLNHEDVIQSLQYVLDRLRNNNHVNDNRNSDTDDNDGDNNNGAYYNENADFDADAEMRMRNS